MSDTDFRTIQSIGRDKLISELMEGAPQNAPHVIKGYGDDAAVVQSRDSILALYTSETLMEGVDFDLTYTPLHHLGYKALSAAVSDIYAMNGKPQTILVNLAVPNKLSVDMLKSIYQGIHAASGDYGVQVVGGDLTASHQTLSLSISCAGEVPENDIVYRGGAAVNDAVCVSGDLGSAIAGLRILMREKKFWQESGKSHFQPELDEYEYVVRRQLVPKARRDVIKQFQDLGIKPTAMIDISQGLASEIKHLARASEVGVQLYQAALPIALDTRRVADEMKEDADKYALYGGEDLELLFTLSEEALEQASDELDDIRVVGKVIAKNEGLKMQTAEGDLVKFEDG